MTSLLPYLAAFASAFALTYILTPIVRETNRRLGMVDKPGERRINKTPIPRGGGVALMVGVIASLAAMTLFLTDFSPFGGAAGAGARFWKIAALSVLISLLGLADDKFSLPPKIKLAGQLVIAALAWLWADLGFRTLWPNLPAWLDCVMTVFWIAGAVNAFNLIDGLDGLASGLALIATLGMGGALCMTGHSGNIFFHCAFAGGLLAFLRYNYHPASVFLGDSGSMFIGFILSVLALAAQTPNSFLISIGVPLLAMGVPIFDTGLAIIRRSIRRQLNIRTSSGGKSSGEVMTADSDHLHHRILRAAASNQRKAAWTLYIIALCCVVVGLVGMTFKSRAGGLWLFAVAAASVVIFKDVARVELFDAGRLLNSVVRDRAKGSRRKIARLAVPFYVAFDVAALVAVFFVCSWAMNLPIARATLRVTMPIRVISIFTCLVFFKAYSTVWSRAMSSNYVRILLACLFGGTIGGGLIYYLPPQFHANNAPMTLLYVSTSAVAIAFIRLLRGIVRDTFYAIDCSRLKGRKDVSRVLVYGCGLRYRAFRRELVRSTASNDRIIVGLLDDDILLRGHYIGGLQVLGTLAQAPEIINAVNADSVVIACEVKPEWMKIVKDTLKPCGVKITHFTFSEKEIQQ